MCLVKYTDSILHDSKIDPELIEKSFYFKNRLIPRIF